MSTRDSRLSAEERAALAHLEAAAIADDPHLASRLRGSGPTRLNVWGSRAQRDLASLAVRAVSLGWWGALVAVVGIALIVVAVATTPWLGILGAVVAVAGLLSLARAIEESISKGRPSGEGRSGP